MIYTDILDSDKELLINNSSVIETKMIISDEKTTGNFVNMEYVPESENKVDFANYSSLSSDATFSFENDELVLTGTNGHTSVKYDILDLIKNNPNRLLGFYSESHDFSKGNEALVQIYYYDGSDHWSQLLYNNDENTFTIPNNTGEITSANFQIVSNNTETVVDTSVTIKKPMVYLDVAPTEYQLYVKHGGEYFLAGESKQKTRSGRNLYNYEDVIESSGGYEGATVDEKGWITIAYDNSNGTDTKYINYYTNNLNLKPSTNYNIIVEIKEFTGTGYLYFMSNYTDAQGNSCGQFVQSGGLDFDKMTNGMIHQVIRITKPDFTNVIQGLRSFVQWEVGKSGSITFRISVLENTSITADTFEYEPFGVMPSPNYPSKIINLYKAGTYNTIINDKLFTFTINDDLRKVGNSADKVWINTTANTCQIEKNTNVLTLDGSEEWTTPTQIAYSLNKDTYFPDHNMAAYRTDRYLTTHFSNVSGQENASVGNVWVGGSYINFNFDNNVGGIDNFKTWLSTHNVEVSYILNTSQTINVPLTVNNTTVLTQEDSIKTWTLEEEKHVPDVGFIGQFTAKMLTGELQNISDDFNIENKFITLLMGISRYNSQLINWYQLGSYLVTEPEDDEVKDNTSFEAFDYGTLFNVNFNPDHTSEMFQTSFKNIIKNGGHFTALQLAQYTCEQVGVQLGTTSFNNDSFKIDSNQFIETDTCRDVMKAISQLAYGWVEIGWDNICYIVTPSLDKENITINDTITYNEYYNLETQKNKYGPITRVIVGLENVQGEQDYQQSPDLLLKYGIKELPVWDNPITWTMPLRHESLLGCESLFGLEYTPLKTETIGHPWLKANQLIKVVNMEGVELYTYPFTKIIKYSGHIRTEISSEAKTDAESSVGYDKNFSKNLKDIYFRVNKELKEMEALISDQNGDIEQLKITMDGLKNVIMDAGGNNILRNTGLSAMETIRIDEQNSYQGFEFWEGQAEKESNFEAISKISIFPKSNEYGNFRQQVVSSNLTHTLSFQYRKNVALAKCSVKINETEYALDEQTFTAFEKTFLVSTKLISVEFITDTEDALEIYDIMLNVGESSLLYSQNENEITTDTVQIGKGITIKQSNLDTTFKADADGVRILNASGEATSGYTGKGMWSDSAEINDNATISGLLIKRSGKQTWLTGI